MENHILVKVTAILSLSIIAVALILSKNDNTFVLVLICVIISGIAGYNAIKVLRNLKEGCEIQMMDYKRL